ncbi:NAD(P)H-dependent oxidoreductase [Niallia sp.]|uniref:NAD(P)H-dependent oxidoreductase n=1 Tax=Niallia sp. TaxID=2837523 RepID=UPI0028A2D9C2|nr:NAD(P)H-dependent oxidoreductase [Niallia sp.]
MQYKQNGVTSDWGKTVFKGIESNQLHLADYNIKQINQEKEKRTAYLKEVFSLFKESDVTLIGTPVYWLSMTGYLKTFINRFTDVIDEI